MKRTLKTEGIVLTKKNLLNKDKIVTIFTKDLGKLQVFAKGVKKITSRRLPHLETGNLIKTEIYKKNERFYLQESALISGFYKIKVSQKKQQLLYLFLFVINKLLPEAQNEKDIYNLAKNFLVELSEKDLKQEKLNEYLNALLYQLGYIQKFQAQEQLYKTIEEIIAEKLPEKLL